MSDIKINEYVLKDPKLTKDRVIINMSDIHSNIEALTNILVILKKIKANYICVPGDIVDSVNDSRNEEIINLLKQIGDVSPTFLSLGNHEMFEIIRINSKVKIIESKDYLNFFTQIAKNTNCKFLLNEFENVDLSTDLSISAINVPFSYYGKKEKLEQYKKILENSKVKIDENKFNILLFHSPNSLIQNGKIDISESVIKSMNLILCGHNHGGLVPTFIQDIMNNHYGLVGPYAKLFQSNAYGIYNEDNISLLISNGVTKISDSSEAAKINKILNKLYIPEIDVIHMKPSKEHSLKLKNRNIYKF